MGFLSDVPFKKNFNGGVSQTRQKRKPKKSEKGGQERKGAIHLDLCDRKKPMRDKQLALLRAGLNKGQTRDR